MVGKLFDDIGGRFKDRPGGYLRILKTGYRRGDAAPMALVQLTELRAAETAVTEPTAEATAAPETGTKASKPKSGKTAKSKAKKSTAKKKATKGKKTSKAAAK